MAILGGGVGGAGNPLGGSFTGTAQSIEILQRHAYAYSGLISLNNETKTALSFTTGNYYLDATIDTGGRLAYMTSDRVLQTEVKMNNTTVVKNALITASGEQQFSEEPIRLIIPAYTEVVVELYTNDTGGQQFTINLAAEVYRD